MVKVILISDISLPYAKIGSWTTLYKNYLQGKHQIDCIICYKTYFTRKYFFFSIYNRTTQ